MRDRARSFAIGIALTPVTVLGLVALYARGTVAVILALVGVLLSSVAVAGIYLLERPMPRQSSQPAERTQSAHRGALPRQHVVELDLGVRWDRDSPDPWLIQRDGGAALVLKPEVDDRDRRLVVLVWSRCTAVRAGPPSAAARHEHRLYSQGLRDCTWAAEVRDSTGTPNGQRHFVILTKEETFEVVAPGVIVHRVDRIRLAASSIEDPEP